MKFFACVLDTAGHGISERVCARIEAIARGSSIGHQWDRIDGAAILTAWDEHGGDVSLERTPSRVAVGTARLDNRAEIRRLLNDEAGSDLALILRAVMRYGSDVIRSLLGDFAFVIWDNETHVVIAACDTFAVRQLYYAQHNGVMLIGSRAEPISAVDQYDLMYLADLILLERLPRDRTAYAGVSRLMPASILTVRNNTLQRSTYWSVADFEAEASTFKSEPEAVEAIRDLFVHAIQLRVDPNGRTWAQLSGGLDSSAVVSVVGWLAEQHLADPLAGTVTFVDSSHTGADERVYAEAVIQRWQIPNVALIDPPTWLDPECPSHRISDHPPKALSFFPHDCLLSGILSGAQAAVLLTGWGGDHLFTGDMLHFADRLVRSPLRAVKEMAHISALGRVSFWQFAYQNALAPLLPGALKQGALRGGVLIPDWLHWPMFQRLGLTARVPNVEHGGRVGRKYAHFVASQVASLDTLDDWMIVDEVVSVRHPFLYRPLVELALRLHPDLCVRPHARKWAFREAMQGILPELVRTRVGKGAGGDQVARMFQHRRESLRRLAHDSVLAELGLVDSRRLELAVDLATANPATERGTALQGQLSRTLSVESWLRVRSGRWPHGVTMPLQFARQLQSDPHHPPTAFAVKQE